MFQVPDEKLAFFEENGFVQLENVMSEKEMNELSSYLDEVMAIEGENTKTVDKDSEYFKILNSKNEYMAGFCRYGPLYLKSEACRYR
jgi:hypothetical protein